MKNKTILFIMIVAVFFVAIPFNSVKADGVCQPPSVENCPRPPGHESDPIAPIFPTDSPRPPGHENDVMAPPEHLPWENVSIQDNPSEEVGREGSVVHLEFLFPGEVHHLEMFD
jgi:hypothetical protein